MSPEQARGEYVDARTDIFSVGLVLYEMATGQGAFEGATEPILHDVIFRRAPPPVRQFNPMLPARFESIIQKALEKNRDARYQTATELRADLEQVKQATEDRKASRLRVSAASALAALLIIAGGAVWFAKRAVPSRTAADIKFRRLTVNSYENAVTSGAISPSGKYLAYVDSQGMHVKDIDTGEGQTLAAPAETTGKDVDWEIIGAGWFPDNDRFVANEHPAGFPQDWSSQTTSIWVFSRTNTAPKKLREHAMAWSVSPDGSLISFGTNYGERGERENWQMSADGERAHKVFETDEDAAAYGFSWSPVGQRGLYVKTDASGDSLLTRDREGGSPVDVPTPKQFKRGHGEVINGDRYPQALDLTWLPDGRVTYQVVAAGSTESSFEETCNLWTTRLDQKTGKPLGDPELTHSNGFCFANASTTADGRRVVFLRTLDAHGTAYVADLEPSGTRIGNPRHFTLEEKDEESISDWTADSRTLLIGVNRDHGYGLYTQPLNSSTRRLLASAVTGWSLNEALLSPDGKWVIALLWPEGGSTLPNQPPVRPLVRIPITGGSPQTILQVSRAGPFSCSRPPANVCTIVEQTADGKQMIVTEFDVIRGRGPELARIDLARRIDLQENKLAIISPDATRIAVARGPDGPIEIRSLRSQSTFTVPAKGLDKLWGLTWTADGKGLFVTRHVQGGAELGHLDLQGSFTRLWKSGGPRCWATPSPDGRYLAIYDWQQDSNMWMMENF
jgi:Tol biopolymer transport system component